MKRFLLFVGVGVGIIAILLASYYMMSPQTDRSLSPNEVVSFHDDELEVKVYYNRPKKRNREIFGRLVPFGEVWRTGANEATVFTTNAALDFKGKRLPAGTYSLWTIPNREFWTVIFNKEYGQWGIDAHKNANRKPELDVLTTEVGAVIQDRATEQFTIQIEKLADDYELVLMWDLTVVSVPFSEAPSE